MRGPMVTALWCPAGIVLFSLWLFGILPVSPPQWLTSGTVPDPMVARPALARNVFLALLIMVSVVPFMWIDTLRLRRGFPLRHVSTMIRMVFASRRGAMAFLAMGYLAAQGAWLVSHGVPAGSILVRIGLVIVCGVATILLLPPVAIVLANSSRASGQLLEAVSRCLFPYRVVSLLDGEHLGPTMFASPHDNLRTLLGNSWRGTVHRLVDISPIVIVDARSATPPLCEEIGYMLDRSRVGKAVFVVNADGSAPGLEASRTDWHRAHPTCCPASELPRLIGAFRRGALG